ncbi:hypothetical protein BGW80DRAFT_1271402, partial [Lactifluus volemus]
IQGAIAPTVIFLVHLCYARRIYILSQRLIFPVLIVGLSSIIPSKHLLHYVMDFKFL